MACKILILGGTGSIGIGFRQLLLNDDFYNLTFTSRKEKANCYYGEKLIVGNAKDPIFLIPILKAEDWDIILDFMVYKTEQLDFILDKLLDYSGLYIFVSSARVYQPTDELLSEDSKRILDCSDDLTYLNTREYALEKARQENLLFGNIKNNWMILRPYITFNDNRLQLGAYEKEDWLYRALKGKAIPLPSELLNLETTFTSADEVASLIFQLLKTKNNNADVFNLINPKVTPWSDIIQVYEKCFYEFTGTKLKCNFLPVEELFSCHRGRYQLTMDRLHNRRFSGKKNNIFASGMKFTEPLSDLECKLKHFLKKPQFNKVSFVHEGAKDRVTKQSWCLDDLIGIRAKSEYIRGRFKY